MKSVEYTYLYNVSQLLRVIFCKEDMAGKECIMLPVKDWNDFYLFTVRQGLAPLLTDAVAALLAEGQHLTVPKRCIQKWAAQSLSTEQKYNRRLSDATKLSRLFEENGIRMVVLKGMSIARLYPNPSRRPSCDLDCYLFEDYEKGNSLVESRGVRVDRSHYKHSSFRIGSLTVENHHYCTAIRADKKKKDFEKELRGLLNTESLGRIGDTALLSPGPLFNALFFLEHTRSHFLIEGISLRFIVDWICLKPSLEDPDTRAAFEDFLDRFYLRLFRDCCENLSDCLLGVRTPDELSGLEHRMLLDILHARKSIKYHNGLKTTFQLVRNALGSSWKYNAFSDTGMLTWLLRSFWGKVFEKEPRL